MGPAVANVITDPAAFKPSPTPLFDPFIPLTLCHTLLLKLSCSLTSVVFPPTSWLHHLSLLGWLFFFFLKLAHYWLVVLRVPFLPVVPACSALSTWRWASGGPGSLQRRKLCEHVCVDTFCLEMICSFITSSKWSWISDPLLPAYHSMASHWYSAPVTPLHAKIPPWPHMRLFTGSLKNYWWSGLNLRSESWARGPVG